MSEVAVPGLGPSLMWGPFDLLDEASPIQLKALSTNDGLTWGNPGTVDVELRSFVQHGTLVETENWTNRNLVLVVSVEGSTMDETSAIEVLLLRMMHRASELAYTPRTATVATVFPVLTSTPVPTDNDFTETYENEVIYQVQMTCAPFVRPADIVLVDAIVPPSTPPDNIQLLGDENIGGFPGWVGEIGAAPDDPAESVTYSASGVELTAPGAPSVSPYPATHRLRHAIPATDVTAHRYVYVDWLFSHPMQLNNRAFFDPSIPEVYFLAVGEIDSPDHPGFTRTFFQVPTGANSVGGVGQVTFFASFSRDAFMSVWPSLWIIELGITDSMPALAIRELVRVLDLEGVMPATGSIAVQSPDDTGLGEVLIYTCPRDGNELYLPPCRSYLIPADSSASTLDASSVSGSKTSLDVDRTFHIPADRLPDGDYLAAVRATLATKAPADQVFHLTAAAHMDDDAPLQAPDTWTIDASALYDDTRSGYQFMPLTTLSLPRVRTARVPAAYTAFTINANSGAGTAYLDELFLFNLTTGELTQVNVGDRTLLWIDSPDIGNEGQPGLWMGNDPFRTDQVSAFPFAEAVDVHEFDPTKGVSVTSVVTGPADPVAVSFAYYPQYWYRVTTKIALAEVEQLVKDYLQ